jgi:TonB family protein
MPTVLTLVLAGMLSATTFSPPRTGRLDALSLPSGSVWLQGLVVVRVSAAGEVTETATVYAPGPIGPAMTSAVTGWEFAPALEDDARVEGAVLIAAIVRPPTFPDVVGFGDTMEGTKRLPKDVPAPIHVQAPPYPPLAVGDGVVVVEISVGADGSILSVVPLTPASGFDSAALDAARQWTFRAAERNGERVAGCAYVLFGFVSPALNPR